MQGLTLVVLQVMSEDEIRIMHEAVSEGALVGFSKLSEQYQLPPQAEPRLDGRGDRVNTILNSNNLNAMETGKISDGKVSDKISDCILLDYDMY